MGKGHRHTGAGSTREARLKQALKANLQRRKTAARATQDTDAPKPAEDMSSTGDTVQTSGPKQSRQDG